MSNIRRIFTKKRLIRIGLAMLSFYLIILSFFYFNQEKFYFNPKILVADYQYHFDTPFEEYDIAVDAENKINSLLFKSNNPKGVILYLHGNAGALHEWGLRSKLYTDHNYDILFVDYRGFGKNKSQLAHEQMLYQDMQQVYDFLKTKYDEKNIIVLGFSIGSGLAAHLAANNKPKQLILEAPYYSFEALVKSIAPFLPKKLINYKIPTYQYIKQISCPITIFHGKDDQLISSENAIALQKITSKKIDLHLIENCNHNGIYRSLYYFNTLPTILK